MPARSKAQYRFMRGVASGNIKAKGLTRKQAGEYVNKTTSYSALPAKRRKK
jgi:hypothetical protein